MRLRTSAGGGGRAAAAIAAVALVVAGTLSACSAGPTPTPAPIETASMVAPATGEPAASTPPSPVTGVLTGIDASGLSQVTGFRLRLDDGTQLSFRLGVLENGTEFPPGHLTEHLATSSPVRVFFRVEGAQLVVYRIEDAG